MRIARSKGYGLSPVGRIGLFITLLPSLPRKIGRFMITQLTQWKTTRKFLTSSPAPYGKIWKSSTLYPRILLLCHLRQQRRQRRCGARRRRRHRPLLLLQVRMKRPQLNQVWRKVLLFDPKLRASSGEDPSPMSTVSL